MPEDAVVLKRCEIPLCDVVKFSMDFSNFKSKKKLGLSCLSKAKSKSSVTMSPVRRSKRTLNLDSRPNYKENFSVSNEDSDYEENDSVSAKDSDYEESSSNDSTRHKPKQETPEKENEPCEYELMVQRNKEEKLAFLKSLNFSEISEGLSKSKPRPTSKDTKKFQKKKVSNEPPRKSRRLANLDVDLSEDAFYKRAIEEAGKPKIEFINELKAELPFEEAQTVKEESNWDYHSIASCVQSNKPFVQHSSHFKNMHLVHFEKVVKDRITALDIHPIMDKTFLCAASKVGAIGFYDSSSEANSRDFMPHDGGVTHMRFDPYNPSNMVSSSYDGTMRSVDFEKGIFNQVLKSDISVTYFDFLSPTTLLAAFRNGSVSIVEKRSDSKTRKVNHDCHNGSIKSVSVHPTDKNYFLTATNKRAIGLWDLRMLQEQPVLEVLHHKKSVNSAFFSPVTGNKVLTTSYDDTICIFDSSSLGTKLTLQNQMRHINTTGRWISIFRSTWLPGDDNHFIVGSMNHPRSMDVYNDNLNLVHSFRHDELASITSLFACHPYKPIIAGANSSGRVYLFGTEED